MSGNDFYFKCYRGWDPDVRHDLEGTPDYSVIYFGRALMLQINNVYALRMAGVTMISLGTIWLLTGLMPRWLAIVTYTLAFSPAGCGQLQLVGDPDLPRLGGIYKFALPERSTNQSPERSKPILATTSAWLTRYNRPIGMVVALVFWLAVLFSRCERTVAVRSVVCFSIQL
jgi:hypothetical protein